MKKIIVIGSEGFIGSHLVEYLKKQGHELLRVDVFEKQSEKYVKVDKINTDFHHIFKDFKPEICLNCSGAASVPFSFEQPLNDFNLNVYNVVKLLDAIRLFSPNCKFINFSSAAVYGNPKLLPIQETFDKNPISPYGFHKSVVESILEEYHRYFNLQTCTLRLFSAYGNGLKKQIMYDLYNKFVSDKSIILFGTGQETRDYIHINDICRIVELVLQNLSFTNDVINVANGEEVLLSTVVNIFKTKLKSDKEICYSGNIRTGDPSRWQADISRIKSWGYKKSITLEEGIERYIEWIKNE